MSSFFTTAQIQKLARVEVNKDELEPDCIKCGAHKHCSHPKVKPFGEGKKKILIVFSKTCVEDDKNGIPGTGYSASYINDLLEDNGINMRRDCWRMNAVSCFSYDHKFPNNKQIKFCTNHILKYIYKFKPQAILLVGDITVASIYHPIFYEEEIDVNRFRGLCIPDREFNANVFAVHDPIELQDNSKNQSLKSTLKRDIKFFADNYTSKFVSDAQDYRDRVKLLVDFEKLRDKLTDVLNNEEYTYIDFETTGLKPHRNGHKIVTMALYDSTGYAYAFPLRWKDYWTKSELKEIESLISKIFRKKKIKKAAHSLKFEDNWANFFISPVNGWEWDTLIGAHIIDNRSRFTGEKFQVYINYGIRPYDKFIKYYLRSAKGTEFNRIEQAELSEILTYNGFDVFFGHHLREKQRKFFTRKKNKSLVYPFNLFMKGTYEMSQIQLEGLDVDTEYYQKKNKWIKKKIRKLKKEITRGPEARKFKKQIGRKLKVTGKGVSSKDLGILLYDVLKIPAKTTDKGNYKTDKKVLERIRIPFTKKLLELKKWQKADNTYFAQFLREVYKGKIYPFFDLHVPVTYRSSSSRPNFQNIPKRDYEIMKIIRGGIIPKLGCYLVEADFSGAEVITSLCYHKDPTFEHDITVGDMHRDLACELFFLNKKDFKNPKFNKKQLKMMKDIRQETKSEWTFAQFYGDWYGSCIPNLWELAEMLKVPWGKKLTLKDHLAENGIYSLDDFLEHGKFVENEMWNERFQLYTQWKDDVYKEYIRKGFLTNFLGFVFQGLMSKNQCNNYPIQSASFHLLLYTLIKMQKVIRKKKMKTRIIGQIHDSIIANVPKEEMELYSRELQKIVKKLKKRFDWLVLPMEIEIERSKLREDGGNFAEMEEYKLVA